MIENIALFTMNIMTASSNEDTTTLDIAVIN